MTDREIESEIVAKGLTGPRVTPQMIEESIAAEYCFTADQAIASVPAGAPHHPALELLTICVLVLKNGFTVIGESACISPQNFDRELGGKIARQKARDKIWQLEGYRLKSAA